jgi:hypothetical protein
MRKWQISLAILALIAIAVIVILRSSNEDDWIKDSKGVWVKHGNPSETPQQVLEQQNAVSGALKLYNDAKSNGFEFNSQCLGTVDNYSIDIVHVPRANEDNLAENQCEAYRNGSITKFIELDKDGNIARAVDGERGI